MNTIVVNLFGAPASGKSTGAAYIFARLTMKGINAELVTEFAKDKVWEGSEEFLKNQCYIFAEQEFRLFRCVGKVDVIVTDSPLPLSIVYNSKECLGESFYKAIIDTFNSYNNLNFLLKRVKPYNTAGRVHTEAEANAIGDKIINTLLNRGIAFKEVEGDIAGFNYIVDEVIKELGCNNPSVIDDFSGNYFFLSNFFVSNVTYKFLTFTNTEAAFHAMKCPERAKEFCNLSPSSAKRLGRKVPLRPDWEDVKRQIMYEVCYAKFTQNPDLKAKLLATGNKELVEGNHWGDKYWGVCNGEGENNLGKILMEIRNVLANSE